MKHPDEDNPAAVSPAQRAGTTGPPLQASSLSHTGLRRRANEDSFVEDPALGLWLVADGMGGAGAGEVASAIAAIAVHRSVAGGTQLPQALAAAHGAIEAAARTGSGAPGMGTTAVALRSTAQHYQLAWVGDSRAYRWDTQGLKRLTRDHSLVQELVDAGIIGEQEARTHPRRNLITRCLGAGGETPPVVDTLEGRWSPQQSILLCSDGLTGELGDPEIAAILAASMTPQDAVRQLCSAALARGGRDNITLILISGPA